MKSCLLCHTVTEDSSATCPGCGHADWAAVAEEALPPEAPAPEAPAPEAPPATASASSAPKKGKRGR